MADGANGWIEWGPWGNFGGAADYYTWGGAWGYLHFVEFDQTDGANGLYYIHGRWYRPDLGLFISPDDKGEYFYSSGDGQDPVNKGWELRNNQFGQDTSTYNCDDTSGCVGNLPSITARCRRDVCQLDPCLDKAVSFYARLYRIPNSLLDRTLVTEYMNDRQPGQDAVDICNFSNAATAQYGITPQEERDA